MLGTLSESLRRPLLHPRRPSGSQSGREKRRDERNFRRAFSLDPTYCPWVSEDASITAVVDTESWGEHVQETPP